MSPIKTIREADARRLIKIAFLAGFLAMIANAAAIGIFVSRTNALREEDKRELTAERVNTCQAVNHAFGIFTDAFVRSAASSAERTPEEQAQFDRIAEKFASDVEAALPDCAPDPVP